VRRFAARDREPTHDAIDRLVELRRWTVEPERGTRPLFALNCFEFNHLLSHLSRQLIAVLHEAGDQARP
jgi:hypothetical protein